MSVRTMFDNVMAELAIVLKNPQDNEKLTELVLVLLHRIYTELVAWVRSALRAYDRNVIGLLRL
jgi:hypothetical protein